MGYSIVAKRLEYWSCIAKFFHVVWVFQGFLLENTVLFALDCFIGFLFFWPAWTLIWLDPLYHLHKSFPCLSFVYWPFRAFISFPRRPRSEICETSAWLCGYRYDIYPFAPIYKAILSSSSRDGSDRTSYLGLLHCIDLLRSLIPVVWVTSTWIFFFNVYMGKEGQSKKCLP